MTFQYVSSYYYHFITYLMLIISHAWLAEHFIVQFSGVTWCYVLAGLITTTTDSFRHHEGCFWLYCCAVPIVPIPSVSDGSKADCLVSLTYYANYAMGPPQVSFSLSEMSLPVIVYWYYGVSCLLSGSHMVRIHTNGGSTICVCTIGTIWNMPVADICASWYWGLVHTGVHWVAVHPSGLSWVPHVT